MGLILKMGLLVMGILSSSAYGKENEFVRFQVGSFIMGSPEKQVMVTLTHSFAIATTEVTQKQWFEVMEKNPSYFSKSEYCDDHRTIDGVGMCPEHPVESVSWSDVQEFIKKLNEREGNVGCGGEEHFYEMPKGCYRLPTEAEWEYVASEGMKEMLYSSGDLDDYRWCRNNSGNRTHRVGSKKADSKGMRDIYGNVWEWVQDGYLEELQGGKNPLPTESTTHRGIRGGAWNLDGKHLHPANRNFDDGSMNLVGFRLVRAEGGPERLRP